MKQLVLKSLFFFQGWHLCKKSLSYKRTDSNKENLKNMSPYLGRLYALAKQSHLNLNCIKGENGQEFIEWIEQVYILLLTWFFVQLTILNKVFILQSIFYTIS